MVPNPTPEKDFPWWLVVVATTGLFLFWEVLSSEVYAAVLGKLARHLEEGYGCEVVAASGNLSDRKRLAGDLDAMPPVEAYLTEIKAAAVDVVTRRGAEEGRPVLYCDNDPVGEGLDAGLLALARRAVAGG